MTCPKGSVPGPPVLAPPWLVVSRTPDEAMALRAYRDPAGEEWRVWRVVPDSTSFATLDESYREGWLCFERMDGTDRCRLSIGLAPAAWETMPDSRLDELRRQAEPAVIRTPDSAAAAPHGSSPPGKAKRRR